MRLINCYGDLDLNYDNISLGVGHKGTGTDNTWYIATCAPVAGNEGICMGKYKTRAQAVVVLEAVRNAYERGDKIFKLPIKVDEHMNLINAASGSTDMWDGIKTLDIGVHTYNVLWRGNVKTIMDAVTKGRKKLMDLRGMGKTTMQDLEKGLREKGIELNE